MKAHSSQDRNQGDKGSDRGSARWPNLPGVISQTIMTLREFRNDLKLNIILTSLDKLESFSKVLLQTWYRAQSIYTHTGRQKCPFTRCYLRRRKTPSLSCPLPRGLKGLIKMQIFSGWIIFRRKALRPKENKWL